MTTGERRPRHPFFDFPGPLALAHRGFSLQGLENTMAAFGAAVELGYRYLETDARATSDGIAIAFHDRDLARLTDRVGRVADLPWREIRLARVGHVESVLTIEDVLGAWPDMRVNIDVKDPRAVAPLARAIERTRAHHRVCVASFSDRRRREVVRRLSAPVATSGGRGAIAAFRFAGAAQRVVLRALRDIDCLQVPERVGRITLVTAATVAAAHAMGRQLHAWTVNDDPSMHRLFDLGVDGIVTDRADVLREVLTARGAWHG